MTARIENLRTLRGLAGLDEQAAQRALDARALITVAPTPICVRTGELLSLLLGRSIAITADPSYADVEIVVGPCSRRSSRPVVHIAFTGGALHVGQVSAGTHIEMPLIFALLAACYGSAHAFRHVAPGATLPPCRPVVVDVDMVVSDRPLDREVTFSRTFLAGAGAIGNGFALALSLLPMSGELVIADPDVVDGGNLNRQVLFYSRHVGVLKAPTLASWITAQCPRINAVGHPCRLQQVPHRTDGAWLENLVVAVDSRRARRHLQDELPLHVFDASTTGLEEIVLSFGTAIHDGACLRCTYPADATERAREVHVADSLGVSVDEVREQHISFAIAEKIALRYPEHSPSDFVGLAFDTVFKRLCGAGKLRVDEARAVLAPLAFVSVLAGTLLALEFFRRSGHAIVAEPFNYWRVSPWSSPMLDLRAMRPAQASCECLGDITRRAVGEIWGADGGQR